MAASPSASSADAPMLAVVPVSSLAGPFPTIKRATDVRRAA